MTDAKTSSDTRKARSAHIRVLVVAAICLAVLVAIVLLLTTQQVNDAYGSLAASLESTQHDDSAALQDLLFRQQALTWALLAALVALAISLIVAVFRSAYHPAARIQDGEANRDYLTGLYDRSVFDRLLHAPREEPIALLLIDADNFKSINDTQGHDAGDAMLQKLANQLTKSFRQSDYPCRIGGDEFAVIMTNIGPELKHVVQARIDAVAAGMRDESDGLPAMTLSIGVAFSETGMEGDALFKRADTALYQVKEAGRNGSAFHKA